VPRVQLGRCGANQAGQFGVSFLLVQIVLTVPATQFWKIRTADAFGVVVLLTIDILQKLRVQRTRIWKINLKDIIGKLAIFNE
jgi:hypothetical protein